MNAIKNQKGQTLIEYGLIGALVILVVIATLTPLGQLIAGVFERITNAINAAV